LLAASHLLVTLSLEHLWRAIASIGEPFSDQLFSNGLVTGEAEALNVRPAISAEIGSTIPTISDRLELFATWTLVGLNPEPCKLLK
jgi:hypothetical protein